MDETAKRFYDREYEGDRYSAVEGFETHYYFEELRKFVATHALAARRCLEIGCGRGLFQDLVADYTGTDISSSAGRFLHKPFFVCSALELPFRDNTFDGIWTLFALEHIDNPEEALMEMRRVLKPGGLLFLAPAWQCFPWAAKGYPVRPYGDLSLRGKLNKASIPVRRSVVFRSLYVFPRRLWRLLKYLLRRRSVKFSYRTLKPNYEHFWMPDSDAINSIDPFDAFLWFRSRGDACLNLPTLWRHLFVRTGPVILEIRK